MGFPPSTPNAYTTDCLSSIIIFPPNFHLSISCRYRQIFVWVSALDRLCHRIMCCSNVFAIVLLSNSCVLATFLITKTIFVLPLLCASVSHCSLVLSVCFRSLFFVEKRQSIVKFHWRCGSALLDLRCIFQMLVRSQGRFANTHLLSGT